MAEYVRRVRKGVRDPTGEASPGMWCCGLSHSILSYLLCSDLRCKSVGNLVVRSVLVQHSHHQRTASRATLEAECRSVSAQDLLTTRRKEIRHGPCLSNAIGDAMDRAQRETRLSERIESVYAKLPYADVHAALERTDSLSIRCRKVPAQVVVFLLVAMALCRELSLVSLVRQALAALPAECPGDPGSVVRSTLTDCRKRLPWRAVRELVRMEADKACRSDCTEGREWHGLRVQAIDGTLFTVPDSLENRSLGVPSTGQRKAGYPKIRLLGLVDTHTHAVIDARLGGYSGKGQGEMTLARKMIDDFPDYTVTLFDKLFMDHVLFHRIVEGGTNRHFLVRLKKKAKYRVVKGLGNGDCLVELTTDYGARRRHPDLPRRLIVRLIVYRLGRKKEPVAVLTSLLNHHDYPAADIAKLYSKRWEAELVFKDIKVELLSTDKLLRSRLPDLVRQEVWALLLVHNLLRSEMVKVATKANVPPTRVSFKNTMMLMRHHCLAAALAQLLHGVSLPLMMMAELPPQLLDLLILPERREGRYFPRHVKIQATGYKKNKGGSHGRRRRIDVNLVALKAGAA